MKKENFSKIIAPIEPPSLLEMQLESFEEFLQKDETNEKRKPHGLQGAFKDVFPIQNSDGSLTMEFVSYYIGEPKYSMEESIARDATYAAPLRIILRLVQKQENGKEKELAEQEVYFGDIPLMTDNASFIINGAERVVVSQIHRSPGIIFEEDEEKRVTAFGKPLYFARMIPYRGAWVEFEFDQNNILYVRIDRKRKILATTFLKALGFESDSDILELFLDPEEIVFDQMTEPIIGRFCAIDIVDKSTGEVIFEAGREIKEESVEELKKKGVKAISLHRDPTILLTLKKDAVKTKKEAISLIYKILKTQEFIIQERAEGFLDELLFKSTRRYDLSRVGRYKIFKKLGPLFSSLDKMKKFNFATPSEYKRTLTKEDVICTIKYLLMIHNGISDFTDGDVKMKVQIDDIDHLGNRRVRSVGELLENQVRIGLVQMTRLVREHMNMQDKSTITPRGLINITPFVAQVRKFFGTSQLSQFMDQTNPLAELTHKRRLSALGPGGLHRKRAGFEVRDVHHTHYGRICPIETPEGPNIGLITSLATYARINEYGLIESPYRKVEGSKVSDKIDYLTADREDEYIVAQANSPLDKNGKFTTDLVACRFDEDFPIVPPTKVDYMDISPMQVISISAALIPFLEHDDANRALMGSNMQRQAVPLLWAEQPVVATGIEENVAKDSGVVVLSKRAGEVVSVSAEEICIWGDGEGKPGIDVYNLRKYARSNQDTCINQTPIVNVGQKVKKREVIADGPCTSNGQLALGKNVLVAFMPWDGYNFEDAILLSEKLVREDTFTSVHIKEFQTESREAKGRPEEITRDIPNVGADDLLNLDEEGIIRIGATINRGDILVGKTAPKGEQQSTPEERLLRVLFGKKAEDVQDASLRVPPGVTGKVIGVRTFVRREKIDEKELKKKHDEIEATFKACIDKLKKEKKERLAEAKGEEKKMFEAYYEKREELFKEARLKEKERIKKGDELAVTVNEIVKVYIATKHKIQVGDKLAGRHGNKGVVARILPIEDMPRMPDGTAVDAVLSPLSIPSRMNVGQLLETMLGWAAKVLNVQMVTPVFDGATEAQIAEMFGKARAKLVEEKRKELSNRGMKGPDLEKFLKVYEEEYLPSNDSSITMYDGRTGEAFLEKVTIGYMYVLKLIHLVEEKIHARSTGPYSLITRQPLGGKAQFGGQRFGEMEVWAVEGYGAAHVLQEFLTVKSDDVNGRIKMYDAIVRGEMVSEPGIPESFKVLIHELRGLGLNVELLSEKKDEKEVKKKEKKVAAKK